MPGSYFVTKNKRIIYIYSSIYFQICVSLITAMKFKEQFLSSKATRITALLIVCLAIGFIAPAIINIFLDFSPPNPYIAGTCHIQMGMRSNCFPDIDAKNQVN